VSCTLEAFELLALALIGLFAGLVGGMLGVGGSIVMIPAMTEVLGPDQHLYQAAAMIVNFFVVVPAVYQHRRAGAVEAATVLRIVPLAAVAVIGGVAISELPFFAGRGEANLRGLFALFLLFVAGFDFYRLFRSRVDRGGASAGEPQRRTGWTRAACVAVPTGLIAGLLGVGGGIVAVPLQRWLLRIPMRTAVANSATIIIATSLIGSFFKNAAYVADHDGSTQSFLLAAILIPTAIVGSLFGSRLTHQLPLKVVKAAFFALLFAGALRLTYKAWGPLQPGAPGDVAARTGSPGTICLCTPSGRGIPTTGSTLSQPVADSRLQADRCSFVYRRTRRDCRSARL